MDLRQLDAINTVVAAAVKGLTPFFSNCVDIVYAPTPLAEGRLSWAQLLLQPGPRGPRCSRQNKWPTR